MRFPISVNPGSIALQNCCVSFNVSSSKIRKIISAGRPINLFNSLFIVTVFTKDRFMLCFCSRTCRTFDLFYSTPTTEMTQYPMESFRIKSYEEHGLKKLAGLKPPGNQYTFIKTGKSVPKPVTMAELVEHCDSFVWDNDLNDCTYYKIDITMSRNFYAILIEIF